MPNVKHLFRAPKRRLPMEELAEVRVEVTPVLKAVRTREPTARVKSCWWIVKL